MKSKLPTNFNLDTPCLVLDLDALDANMRRMQATVSAAGKQLRPHVKTHKCSALARLQLEAGAVGICAATVSEAEGLVQAGVRGVLVTGPVATRGKAERLVNLLRLDHDLMVAMDSFDGLKMLERALQAAGQKMDILLDIDVGLHRTGVSPTVALELAAAIATREVVRLRGIQAYAGHLQHVSVYEERQRLSLDCLQDAVRVFRAMRDRYPNCTVFSTSGTGTFDIDLALPEITEIQPGSYVCMDAEYINIGSDADPRCFTAFAPVLRVLTTVVSTNQEGFVTVDAGLKALYRDGGQPAVFRPANAGLSYDWFGDEYGRITCSDASRRPVVGDFIELIPSHCDPTINLFDRFHLVREGKPVGAWPIDLRGYDADLSEKNTK